MQWRYPDCAASGIAIGVIAHPCSAIIPDQDRHEPHRPLRQPRWAGNSSSSSPASPSRRSARTFRNSPYHGTQRRRDASDWIRSRLADFSIDEPGWPPDIPLEQIGHSEIRLEDPILKRRDRTAVVTISLGHQ